jgi:hypothetical protein
MDGVVFDETYRPPANPNADRIKRFMAMKPLEVETWMAGIGSP